jgi:hypothetical protein
MLSYVKRYWNEPRGDEHDGWGMSWWYFEISAKGRVFRQIELYDSGVRLCYSEQDAEDEFGRLSDTPIDLSDRKCGVISSQEFEAIWRYS